MPKLGEELAVIGSAEIIPMEKEVTTRVATSIRFPRNRYLRSKKGGRESIELFRYYEPNGLRMVTAYSGKIFGRDPWQCNGYESYFGIVRRLKNSALYNLQRGFVTYA